MATHAPITGAPTRAPIVTAHRLATFCKRHGMAETRFGRDAANDPRLIADIRMGRTLSDRLAARVLAFMEAAQC